MRRYRAGSHDMKLERRLDSISPKSSRRVPNRQVAIAVYHSMIRIILQTESSVDYKDPDLHNRLNSTQSKQWETGMGGKRTSEASHEQENEQTSMPKRRCERSQASDQQTKRVIAPQGQSCAWRIEAKQERKWQGKCTTHQRSSRA